MQHSLILLESMDSSEEKQKNITFPLKNNSQKVQNLPTLLPDPTPRVTTGLLQAAEETKRLCFLWFTRQLCRGRFPKMTRCMEFKGRLALCQERGGALNEGGKREKREAGHGTVFLEKSLCFWLRFYWMTRNHSSDIVRVNNAA